MMRKIVWATTPRRVDCGLHHPPHGTNRNVARSHDPFRFHHGSMGYIAHELDLSNMQKSQIKTIWEGARPNTSELVREFASEQKEMDAPPNTRTTHVTRAGYRTLRVRQGATLAKLLSEKKNLAGKICSQILTPGQRTIADELRKHWGSHLEHLADWISNTTGK